MLVPLRREAFEQILPLIATGPQYAYYWGKWRDILRRILISFVGIVIVLVLNLVFGTKAEALWILLGIVVGLYWLWSPIYWASRRNASYRRFPYSGFLRGRVLEVFVTEELIGEEQTVNQEGELVIIENRERRVNVEIGDETGFVTQVQAPLRRIHKVIAPGQIAELVVLSNQPNLSRIEKVTDAYIPSHNLWVGEYPYLQRVFFTEMSETIGKRDEPEPSPRRVPKRRRR
ncbi:MAG: phosphate ABC transporter permease [Cyanobacteriota bacterium]